ncbi:carbonic anhydrase-like isoform X2 [Dreissena polymorpha]|uniref:carbonic anhydrase-like isoform X2 n=1 Tax=Dreissena polymorpha TaxID=45954 RepID=UPI00226562EF|nr:carbonic anhydrase-like isoform X2 [Dreissena polymorpha]XP_052229209.1 carbonic anhydrase-like isoform X2 [Dreissena polymorpha]
MAHWGYTDKNGPSTWKDGFPIAEGSRQSPIDIVLSEAVYDVGLMAGIPLGVDYKPEDETLLQNNGHSVMCQITKPGFLTGGPLGNQKFRLEQFHLHWGADDNRGSEHTIDGKMFASELHLVHWNTKYDSFSDAVTKSDGLAVLGIMIKPGLTHLGFSSVSDNLSKMSKPGSKATVPVSLDPTRLLPNNISAYWTYEGSLTTPPLLESVQWIVFKEPVEFSHQQLTALRSLTDSDGHHMQDNYRPPVPTKGRKVRASFQ